MGSGLRLCGCGVGVFLGCERVQDTVPTCSMGGGVVEVVALGGVGGRSLLKSVFNVLRLDVDYSSPQLKCQINLRGSGRKTSRDGLVLVFSRS